MALKGKWVDKVNGVDMNNADDINQVAHAVIELEGKESGGISQETDPTVPSWAKQPNKPQYIASEVGADASGTAVGVVSAHNVDDESHQDIRIFLSELKSAVNAFLDIDNETYDQLSELIQKIEENADSIEKITNGKVNVADVVNNLTSNVTNKPLSAAQGVALKALIDAISVPTKLSELTGDATHRTVTDAEKTAWNAKLGQSDLQAATDEALAQAKASGEFDGSDGRGIKSIARTSGTGAAGTTDTYTITYTDNTTSTFTVYNGKNGTNGKDYVLTDADRAEMVAMVLEAIGGNPIYGYIDENYHIVLSGNMPDGTYTASYEDENGSIVSLAGQLVKDTNVYYSVTSNLTNCTNSNGTKTVVQGGSYSTTISANSGYELKSVVATMGGSPVSVSGGVINIASVTGDIVITAVAEVAGPKYTNKIPLSTDASGNPYNGGQGWKTGYRLSGSSGNESAQTGTEVTGFIPVKYGDTVYLKGITDDGTRIIGFYKSDYSFLASTSHKTAFGGAIGGEIVSFVVNGNLHSSMVSESGIAFMRVSATEITADSIITVNEPIE